MLEGGIGFHLGVDLSFRPATKAHPGFLCGDLDALLARLESAGHGITRDRDPQGRARTYVDDPFGNRLELIGLT